LPGPWESLGVYYLDQSGSGRTAEVNVYELDSQIAVPSFIAIGRAVESAGTTMDISQGAQPSNPPASTVRLWVDGSGNLNKIDSAGNNEIILDNTNYGSYVTLAGDVSGLVGSNVINNNAVTNAKIANGAITSAKINPNTLDLRPQSLFAGDLWCDRGNSTAVLYFCDGSHYLYRSGASTYVLAGGTLDVSNQVNAPTFNASSNIYYFSSNNGIWMQWNGGGIQFSHYVMSNGNLYARGGVVYMGSGDNCNWSWNGTRLAASTDISTPGAIYVISEGYGIYWGDSNRYIYNSNAVMQFGSYPGLYRFFRTNWGGYIDFTVGTDGHMTVTSPWGNGINCANFVVPGGSMGLDQGRNNVEVSTYTHTYAAGSMYIVLDCSATSYATRSALKYKGNISTIDSDECLKLILDPQVEPVRYKSVNTNIHSEFAEANRPPDSSYPNPDRIGFIAEQLDLVVPEAVCYSTDDDTPDGISYAELTAILWGAVRNLNARIEQLEQPKIAA
jgi:hypothetical protein